jgi:microcystin-dependent protein
MSDPFIAEIRIFAGNFAPRSWAFCDGALLPIATNTALFSLVGTTYGGDGRTTFGLPDIQGRAVIGPGSGPGLTPRSLGVRGGTETETLTTAHLPAHTHAAVGAHPIPGDDDDPQDNLLAATPGANVYGAAGSLTDMAASSLSSTGGADAHTNLQPYLALYYIIALVGIFPSRS